MPDLPVKMQMDAALAISAKPTTMLRPSPSVGLRHDNCVLASLPDAELTAIRRHLQVVSLPPGTPLQHHDFGLDHVYFPHQGVVSLLAVTPNGETIETASTGRAGALCPILESEQLDTLLCTIAPRPLLASRISVGRLRAVLGDSDVLGPALEACREALLLQLRQNLVCNGRHSVELRLARWLLETADRLEVDVIPATQEHVSQRLGVRRTTVTLLASKLQDMGAIRWGRSRIDILDRRRLAGMTCTCYDALGEKTRALLASAHPLRPGGDFVNLKTDTW
jgi:CRP-like cAMP-binding protein